MNVLGLFKLRDVTKERFVIKNATEKEFMEKLSLVTDQSTNVGFLNNNRKFHGLLNADKFRLKRNQTFMNEEFIIKGELKKRGPDLVIELEYIRGPLQTLLPTLFFIIGIFVALDIVINETIDLRYIPFIFILGIVFFGAFDLMKGKEIEKIRDIFQQQFKMERES